MPRSRSLRIGEGATCSVLVKRLRPSQAVAAAIPNASVNQRVDDLVATCHAVTTRRGHTFKTIFFTSQTIPGVELSAARRYVVVTTEGHPEALWEEHVPVAVVVPTAPTLPPVEATHNIIDDDVYFAQNRAEDIARVRNEGFEVDDDNDPAPKNIPAPAEAPPVVIEGGLYEGQTWGWDGIDRRHIAGGRYDEPSFQQGWAPVRKTYLQLFLHFFPMAWFSEAFLPKTSLGVINSGGALVTYGELLRYLGIRLLMATCMGWNIEQFWNYDNVPRDQEEDPCPTGFHPSWISL